MSRRLFCQLSPAAYKLSVMKCRYVRHLKNLLLYGKMASKGPPEPLPVVVYRHNSLICRKLGNVDMGLQENKAVNLSLAAPKISHVLIGPGQIFSFWNLVGNCSGAKGYREGLTISLGKPSSSIGGGMCQLTNLIHWMVLHTDLDIIERHHHDHLDLFPDFNRQIPFGTGTSILYNYLDYQFKNNTEITYQLIVYTDGAYLRGELRAHREPQYSYHIRTEKEFFSQEEDGIYRNGLVYRTTIHRATGNCVKKELLQKNHARICYDSKFVDIIL